MSCYETHKGILKEIELNGKSVKEFLLSKVDNPKDWEDTIWTIDDILYNNYLDHKYAIINNKIYEWINHTVKYDEEEDICMLTPKDDGTIDVFAQFYNGGMCMDEVLEEAFNKKIAINSL